MTDASPHPTTEIAPAASPPEPPRFVDVGRPRSRVIPLEWPVDFDGRCWREIVVRRMTTIEVAGLMERMRAQPEREFRFPMFDDPSGQPVPDAVLDQLDDDDSYALNRAATDFLPRRFRTATDPEAA